MSILRFVVPLVRQYTFTSYRDSPLNLECILTDARWLTVIPLVIMLFNALIPINRYSDESPVTYDIYRGTEWCSSKRARVVRFDIGRNNFVERKWDYEEFSTAWTYCYWILLYNLLKLSSEWYLKFRTWCETYVWEKGKRKMFKKLWTVISAFRGDFKWNLYAKKFPALLMWLFCRYGHVRYKKTLLLASRIHAYEIRLRISRLCFDWPLSSLVLMDQLFVVLTHCPSYPICCTNCVVA